MWECIPIWPDWPGVASGVPWVLSAGPVPMLPAFPVPCWASTGVAASSAAAQAAVSRRAFAMVLSFLLRQRFTLIYPGDPEDVVRFAAACHQFNLRSGIFWLLRREIARFMRR